MHFYLNLLFKINKYPAYVVCWCILTFEANATKMMAIKYKIWMFFMKYYIISFNNNVKIIIENKRYLTDFYD